MALSGLNPSVPNLSATSYEPDIDQGSEGQVYESKLQGTGMIICEEVISDESHGKSPDIKHATDGEIHQLDLQATDTIVCEEVSSCESSMILREEMISGNHTTTHVRPPDINRGSGEQIHQVNLSSNMIICEEMISGKPKISHERSPDISRGSGEQIHQADSISTSLICENMTIEIETLSTDHQENVSCACDHNHNKGEGDANVTGDQVNGLEKGLGQEETRETQCLLSS